MNPAPQVSQWFSAALGGIHLVLEVVKFLTMQNDNKQTKINYIYIYQVQGYTLAQL